jgi:hypothetical protein
VPAVSNPIQGWIRRHYVGLLALFVALGGTAFAAATAPKNSVVSKSIKRGAVKTGDLKNNGVKGIDVDESTLDFDGLSRLVGPAGDKGEQGPVGPTFASVYPGDVLTPPANPDSPILNGQFTHAFTTPADGRLLAFASLPIFGVTCSVGNANAFLYLDGVGLAGSRQALAGNGTPATFTPIVLTDVVGAGEHTLRISYDCPDGNPIGDTSSGTGDLGAILIGG